MGMKKNKGNRKILDQQIVKMQQQMEELETALKVQKQIAYASGIFQQDVTVRTLLESIAEGVVVTDQQGYIVVMNKRAEKLFGYEASALVGRPLTVLIPERYSDVHIKHLHKYFENPYVRPMGVGLDLHGRCKDGTEFPIEVSLSYLKTEHGNFGMAFVIDITSRKSSEQELKLRNEELDAFAHTVAHDLKSSMASIIGFSEALAETHRELSAEELDEYLANLARSGRRMSNIISELLVFASVRKQDVAMRSLDMKFIVESTLLRLRYAIREHGAKVIVPDFPDRSLGYGPWVEEVWYNYLTNALKYGGDPPVVEIGSTLHNEFVEYWVRDNGPGIKKEVFPRIFEPYSNLDMPRIQGHGLGLSIVRRIAEKLDGYVSFESDADGGSKFSFFLRREPNNELNPVEN
ncbi:MAG: hypothetical protein Kow0031_07230 [Anaerolineae bacterium]